MRTITQIVFLVFFTTAQSFCQAKKYYSWQQFVMGADLSYVNEIEDYGGK